jgi:hypothetical protein
MIVSGTGRVSASARPGPGQVPRGVVVDRQVRLLDLGGTLLGLAGLDPVLGRAEDLRSTWLGAAGDAPPSFAEATRPDALESTDRWQNLPLERSVAQGGLMVLRAPWEEARGGRGPRLYEVAAGQPLLPEGAHADEAARLAGLLEAWDASAPPHREVQVSEQTAAGLRALGYLE